MSERLVEVRPDAVRATAYAASVASQACGDAIVARGRADIALSGGETAPALLRALAELAVPWDRVHVFQVDERRAPEGSDERNATALVSELEPLGACLHLMPVGADDPGMAARRYAAALPATFDLVHVGLGPDGHTASLFPDDPAAETTDVRVTWSGEHHGHRRMTLTRPTIDAARLRLWLVTGRDKAAVVERLIAGDPTIPAGRVRRTASILALDRAAAGG